MKLKRIEQNTFGRKNEIFPVVFLPITMEGSGGGSRESVIMLTDLLGIWEQQTMCSSCMNSLKFLYLPEMAKKEERKTSLGLDTLV